MPPKNKTIYLIGSASGIAAPYSGCGDGPIVMQKSQHLAATLQQEGLVARWGAMLTPDKLNDSEPVLSTLARLYGALAIEVKQAVSDAQFFTVLGGDHSCAIGTWSGVHGALKQQGDMGLIWIDAHMDSHTPETSETGNIHGMPLACLLGYGETQLTHILGDAPKLKPEHLCLIGIRSYESGEAELLRRLNVRIFYMEEVKTRGLDAVLAEALAIVKTGTVGYGITIDIDSIDPTEAPGTGVSEPDGLHADALCRALKQCANDELLVGAEIVEFDPHRDQNQMTEKLVARLVAALT